jgi:hypothetical protein
VTGGVTGEVTGKVTGEVTGEVTGGATAGFAAVPPTRLAPNARRCPNPDIPFPNSGTAVRLVRLRGGRSDAADGSFRKMLDPWCC